jgi:hypothetical protein
VLVDLGEVSRVEEDGFEGRWTTGSFGSVERLVDVSIE